MPTTTTNYGFYLPLVNNATDQDLWGGYLNTNTSNNDALFLTAINWAITPETSSFSVAAPTAGSSTTGSAKTLFTCNSTSGAITASLPSAVSAGNGFTVGFKKTDGSANAVIVTPAGSDKIDSAASVSFTAQYDSIVLISDGVSNWDILINLPPVPTGGVQVNQQVFTSGGTYTPTTGMVFAKVELIGGGGGGGGATASGGSRAGVGGGGGGGGYSSSVLSAATIGASQSVSIGSGGNGGSGSSSGSAGGASSFGAILSANGGAGGAGVTSAASTVVASGGGGGAGSGGQLNINGSNGVDGFAISGGTGAGGGNGSPAPLYSGSVPAIRSSSPFFSAGISGANYGGGGSGASANNSATFSGGAGAPGLCIITEYIT